MRSVVAFIASFALATSVIVATPCAARAGEDNDFSGPALPPPSMPVPAADAPTRVYYGYANFGIDAAALTLGVAVSFSHYDHAGYVGVPLLGAYLFGSPAVHALHGNYGRAAGSFALRVGLPLVLGTLTWAVEDHPDCSQGEIYLCGLGEHLLPLVMGVVGATAAVVVDDAGLAWDTKPAGPTWAPTVQASASGMTFGLAGTF